MRPIGLHIESGWADAERKKLREDQVRSLVGAPSLEESEKCVCGKQLEDCNDAYEHMTHGC
jgi:hypothetical protein